MSYKEKIKNSIKISAAYLTLACFCGLVGALFSKAIEIATDIRSGNSRLIFLLPLAGILSVYLFKLFKIEKLNTDSVIKSATANIAPSPLLTPSVFICSVLSHLFGASVGREGAALQLGGGLASLIKKVFKASDKTQRTLIYCGMAGVFSAVFGTPLAAAVFALQVVNVWRMNFKAAIPVLFTSYTAFFTAKSLGSHAERFDINQTARFTPLNLLKAIIIATACGVVALIFCHSIRLAEKFFKRYLKNPYLIIAAGGATTVLLTFLVGSNDYNGAGMNVINNIFSAQEFNNQAFVLKLIFTCVAAASGYKGGEIVPSLFIGATLGSLIASIIGFPITLAAAIGMTSLFCGVTKCPLAAICLSLEMFSGIGLGFMTLAVITAFISSGKISLYPSQNKGDLKNILNSLKKRHKTS